MSDLKLIQDMYDAFLEDNWEKIDQGLEQFDPKKDSLLLNDRTPLMWATDSTPIREELLERILKHTDKIDVDFQSPLSSKSALHYATEGGSPNAVRQLCAAGASVQIVDDRQMQPIHLAAMCNQCKCISILLEYNANPKAKTARSSTPAHLAAEYGAVEALRMLLKIRGIDINSRNDDGNTALHLAAKRGQGKTLRFLVDNYADTTIRNAQKLTAAELAKKSGYKRFGGQLKTYAERAQNVRKLLTAVKSADHKTVKSCAKLLDNNFDVSDLDGSTPLHYAAKLRNVVMISTILAHNGQTESLNHAGESPLQWACRENAWEAAALLVESGANVDYPEKNTKRTPLHLAATYEDGHLLRSLVLGGADTCSTRQLNMKDAKGRTPLFEAVLLQNARCEALLVAEGARLDVTDNSGLTALELAAQEGVERAGFIERGTLSYIDLEVALVENDAMLVEYLLKNFKQKPGIDITEKQIKRELALPMMCALGHLEMVKLLLKFSKLFNVDQVDSYGVSCLGRAAENDNVDIVKFLLSSGAIVNNPKQAGGITPLHIASTAGFCSCIQAIGSHDGVDIDARTETDKTALQCAVEANKEAAAKLLLSFLAEPGDLWKIAESSGNQKMISLFQKSKLDMVSSFTVHTSSFTSEETILPLSKKQQRSVASSVNKGKQVVLCNLKLEQIPFDVFDRASTLELLDMSKNRCTYISDKITNLTKLTTLKFSFNSLKEVPLSVQRVSSLTSLNLSANSIEALPDEVFTLPNLRRLNVSSNVMMSLGAGIGQAKMLEHLDCSDNQLQSIAPQIGLLTNLGSLDISKNALTSIPYTVGQLQRLLLLDLSDNNLKALPSSMSFLTKLTTLHAHNNPLVFPSLLMIEEYGFRKAFEYIEKHKDMDPTSSLDEQTLQERLRTASKLDNKLRKQRERRDKIQGLKSTVIHSTLRRKGRSSSSSSPPPVEGKASDDSVMEQEELTEKYKTRRNKSRRSVLMSAEEPE